MLPAIGMEEIQVGNHLGDLGRGWWPLYRAPYRNSVTLKIVSVENLGSDVTMSPKAYCRQQSAGRRRGVSSWFSVSANEQWLLVTPRHLTFQMGMKTKPLLINHNCSR